MVRNIIAVAVVAFVLFCIPANAQRNRVADTSYNTVNLPIDRDIAYEKVIDFIQNSEYFIVSLYRESGFIQAKTFREYKKTLSSKDGERITLNFVVHYMIPRSSKIVLSIYREEFFSANSADSASTYNYRELGVSEDRSLYKEILDRIKQYIKKEL